MKAAAKDELVGAGPLKSRGDVVVVTRQGWGKQVALTEFPNRAAMDRGHRRQADRPG
ncbi:MAG: hypothetical protein U0401_17995 [Anaerolineae bacterium]